jgi:hypothetical protein
MTRRWWSGLGVSVALSIVSLGAAHAQAPPSCQDEAAARSAFEEGVERARQRRLADARASYERALSLCPRVPTAYNLAVIELQLGEARASRDRASALLDGALGELSQPQRRAVRQVLREAQAAIGTLRVTVTGAAANGGTLSLDGHRVAALELGEATDIEVDPGRHLLVVSTPDGRTLERTQSIAAGGRAEVELTLPLRPDHGRLIVEAEDETARVEIVGVAEGRGRVSRDVPARTYVVRLPDAEVEEEVRVVAQQTFTIRLDDGGSIVQQPWFWVVTGSVVAAGVATAILVAVLTSNGAVNDPVWGRVELLRDDGAALLRF